MNMKVYYEFEPTDDGAKDMLLLTLYEKYKYELMWTLRSIENEINDSEGQIIITTAHGKSGVKTNQFTRELTDKIMKLIKESTFPSPFFPGMPAKER